MNMLTLLRLHREVDARRLIPEHLKQSHPFSASALWTYYLRTKHEPEGKSCPYCEMFDGRTFIGSEIRMLFPDYSWLGDDIYVNIHKTLWGKEGTCACLLIREPMDEDEQNLQMWSETGAHTWYEK
jgi:hypothetical protein